MMLVKMRKYTLAIVLVFGLTVCVFGGTDQNQSIDNNRSSTETNISSIEEPSTAITGQSMSISPSAKISWDELVRLSQAQSQQAEPMEMIVPYMTVPKREQLNEIEIQPQPADALYKLEESGVAGIPPVGINFQALPDDNTQIPPDTHGAIGKNHAMTMLNTQVRIQNKLGNIISTVSLAAFWAPAGASGVFDPRIIYDQGADRWLATCDADRRSAASAVLFAISDTDDPTGGWTFYKIDADPTNIDWSDYPDIGFNNTWIAITNNMYAVSDDSWGGAAMWVIDKSTALAGGALSWTFFPIGSDTFGGYSGATLRVCHTFGSESKLYIADNAGWAVGTHVMRISKITGTASTPVWSATPGISPYNGTGWFYVANDFDWNQIDAAQAGTSARINTNTPGLVNTVFRNGHIWTCHSAGLPIGAVDRTAVFWYELDPSSMPTPIVQSGVLDGGVDVHHFFPSIAANTNDDAFIGFSRSDPTIFAEAAYTGRLATDPLGTMDVIRVLKAGEDSYIKDFGYGQIRWGDYSATVIDPSDDLCAWTIQEYAALDVGGSASNDRWGTWWGKICVGGVCDCEPGNMNADGVINIFDVTGLISYLYLGGAAPIPYELCNGDMNCDCVCNIFDVTGLISFLYLSGTPPCTCEEWLTACGPPLRK